MTTMTRPKLTDEQHSAVDALSKCRAQVQTLGGFAGTGKSTVIRELVELLPQFAVCAFTGKAARVLQRKGLNARTIHSTIYRVEPSDDDTPPVFNLTHPTNFDYAGIIVDEGSMVSKPIYNDLLTFDVPLIFVGDHGQLEPINSGGFNLMETPDITLEKIHRNAGCIAHFAEYLRGGGSAADYDGDTTDDNATVEIVSAESLADINITSDDQMICAYNKTRTNLNDEVRSHLQLPSEPVIGDRVMCLQNDRRLGVFNGMQGILTRIDQRCLSFKSDDGRDYGPIRYPKGCFGSRKVEYQRGVIPFDYAYCVTCHKAQGDEWDTVVVLEQRCDLWDHRRWAYTAASRAKMRLVWVKE